MPGRSVGIRMLGVFLAGVATLGSWGLAANEIGFIEKFALAKDRAAVLQQLVPATEEYYFFHALHFQNTAQAPKLAAIMGQWAKRFPDSAQRRIIENREAIIGYDTDPQKTLKYLREKLGLEFNHVQEVRDAKPDLPAALDQKLISRDVFLHQALADDGLSGLADDELERLVRDKTPLRPPQRNVVLTKLTRPDVPGLVEMIAEDLRTTENRQFGQLPAHRLLLPEQLDALAKLVPAIAEQSAFVFAKLRKLAPGADADAELDPAEREAWLDRQWAYVKTLPASFNSLKAHVLYARLQHDRSRGVYDKARFLEYLKLPRSVPYMNPKYLGDATLARNTVDLNANFDGAGLGIPPIRTDEALVRDYLLHFFVDEDKWETWAQWLRDTYVKPLFAEAKITAGVGDPEKWASLLTPQAFQALKDRVDIEFPANNAQFLAPADDVAIDVTFKHAPKLIVKIYEINTLSFFLTQKRQLNTDLNLDGLVANSEQTHDGEASPFKRVTRPFKFPELKGKRGAWVIEFIGGGKSSRALIRKGQFSLVQQTGPAGDLLTVLDETRQPVKEAVAWLDGRRFGSSAGAPPGGSPAGAPPALGGAGEAPAGPLTGGAPVLLPFTAQPGRRPIVLASADGTFASLANFEHHAEEYRLDAQFHIEREQLLGRRDATLAVRTALLLGDARIALELLQEAKLTITSTTLDGIATTSEVKSPKLAADKVFTHTFSVPERLAKLTVTLSGKVDVLSKGGEKSELTASRSWDINGMDKTEATHDGHLSKFGDSHVFELLGKNGAPLVDQQVVFQIRREGFKGYQTIPLRTDEKGRVALGKLEGVASVHAEVPNGRKDRWGLDEFARTWPEVVHAKAGEVVRVPWIGAVTADTLSLLEVRGGEFVSDQTAAVKATPGFLEISGLKPGDYSLRIRDGGVHTISVRVTAGDPVGGWLLSPNRSLELRDAAPLSVESAKVDDDGVTIQLRNWNKFTRVHVAASRFLPGKGLFGGLANFTRFGVGTMTPDRLPNLFAGGREIGDEYRYILERRYAQKFPGNMLTRPGLLINPWEKRSTDLEAQSQAAMQAPPSARGGRAGGAKAAESLARDPGIAPSAGEDRNIDFLAEAAPTIYNLVPDEKGVVRVPRKALGDRQHVQVYAEDLSSAIWSTFTLAEVPTKFQDLRLTRNLDPAKPFTEKKEVTVLATGGALTLADILTSEMESYDTLGGVHALFTTLSGDANLAKFAWVLQWPSMKDEEKRAKYSEFACHELNFFLSRKDAPFFTKVVQPYLRNKKDKTFMDDYLIGADLKRYLEPWAYARLNVVERALLAQRLPGESANTARHLRELWELLPPNPEEEDRLFETALRGRALEEGLQEADGAIAVAGSARFRMAKEESAVAASGLVPAADAPAAPAPHDPAKPAAATAMGRLMKRGAVVEQLADKSGKDVVALGLESKLAETEALSVVEKRKSADRFSGGLGGANEFFDMDIAKQQRGLAAQQAYFRRLGPTKEWAENNYYQLPIEQQNAELVTINGFWRDFAAWDGKVPFLSANIAEAHRNFTEMMLALAVIDLPFDAPKHTTKTEKNSFTLTAAGPVIVFHKQIKPADAKPDGAPALLVSENFFRQGDRYRQEGNEKFDKFVTDEFLSGVVYGAQLVITNPTSTPLKLDLLTQIPQGALPVLGSKATRSRFVRLEPYTTQQLEYHFYFPAPSAKDAAFPHFPLNVSLAGKSAGAAKATTFKVVKQLSQVDKASWDYISQYGGDEEVWTFIEQNNIERLDLERVAWRARKGVDFFRRLIATIEKRHLYSDVIYSYGVVHNDKAALGEWLRHRDDFLAQCGAWLDTKLVTIDPIERRAYEHLEYSPLVNQRTHRLGAEPKIANPVFREQYQHLLNILAYKPTLAAMDDMSVVYFLFLQDRVEEALARFQGIRAEALATKLQHDYFRTYAAFYEEKLADARAIVAQYSDYPVDRWRAIFAEASAQIDEIEGKKVARAGDKPDREKQQAELAAAEPAFDFKVENRSIALTWKNLRKVTVNYYLMDPEFLFSSSPFVSEDPARFSIIKPTRTATQALPEGKDVLDIPLPGEFAKANVLVEILGAGQRKAQAYHANTFKLTLSESYGRLELRDQAADKPVSKAYVKVYARLKNGTVRFFKDGYTDLRGKFDYASLNSTDGAVPPSPQPRPIDGKSLDYQMLRPNELNEVAKIAILVLSETHGAAVKEIDPPKE